MTDKKNVAELSRLVAAAEAALTAATNYADEHKLGFSWSPFYGGGGYYEGDPEERYSDYGEDTGWSSSSHGC